MITTSADNPQDTHNSAEFWEPRRALTLDAARRHSVFIKHARRFLAGFAMLLVFLLFWYFASAPATVMPTDNPDETVKMVNPIYKGRTTDLLPYRITANEAVRFIQEPDEVKLVKPILNFIRTEGVEESVILAVSGLYDSKRQVLELMESVNLQTDDGYNCITEHGRIFVKGKRIEGDTAISCNGSFGRAAGNAYEINDGYSEFVFKDGVKARLNPNKTNALLRGVSTIKKPASQRPKVSFGGDEPIDVIANKAIYKGEKTILTGKVDVQQVDSRILANRMDLFREQSRIEEDGSIRYGNVNKIVATGNFKYLNPQNSVTGDKGVYERSKDIITVTGNVVFKQKSGNSVTGCKLIYDLITNRAKFEGSCLVKDEEDGDRVVIKIGQ